MTDKTKIYDYIVELPTDTTSRPKVLLILKRLYGAGAISPTLEAIFDEATDNPDLEDAEGIKVDNARIKKIKDIKQRVMPSLVIRNQKALMYFRLQRGNIPPVKMRNYLIKGIEAPIPSIKLLWARSAYPILPVVTQDGDGNDVTTYEYDWIKQPTKADFLPYKKIYTRDKDGNITSERDATESDTFHLPHYAGSPIPSF